MGQSSSVTTSIDGNIHTPASTSKRLSHAWELCYAENASEQRAGHEGNTLTALSNPWDGDSEGVTGLVTANTRLDYQRAHYSDAAPGKPCGDTKWL